MRSVHCELILLIMHTHSLYIILLYPNSCFSPRRGSKEPLVPRQTVHDRCCERRSHPTMAVSKENWDTQLYKVCAGERERREGEREREREREREKERERERQRERGRCN